LPAQVMSLQDIIYIARAVACNRRDLRRGAS
jgi:hypothetical protein